VGVDSFFFFFGRLCNHCHVRRELWLKLVLFSSSLATCPCHVSSAGAVNNLPGESRVGAVYRNIDCPLGGAKPS